MLAWQNSRFSNIEPLFPLKLYFGEGRYAMVCHKSYLSFSSNTWPALIIYLIYLILINTSEFLALVI